MSSIQRGLGKLIINKAAIDRDLENNWAVVAEAIHSILRREAYPGAYEALRDFTNQRGDEPEPAPRLCRQLEGLGRGQGGVEEGFAIQLHRLHMKAAVRRTRARQPSIKRFL